ncbi:MAG: molecular chaperone DnaJ, partial [Alphaproteobacteria bacterium]
MGTRRNHRPQFGRKFEAAPRVCEHPDCDAAGDYPAPRSRDRLRDYRWLCLDHVRNYNKSWNFYAGMNREQIEAETRADVTWRRPTWRMGP